MPRRKVENAPARARTHAKKTKGLEKMALELATLCGVPVGLVCSGAGAGAPPLQWESEEGVLERYRRAVPPEARAGHTHRAYLETELAKRRAKLARARHGCPAALADWDEALNDMTLDDARELLDAIDEALRATGDRMEALGLPSDRGHGHGALGEQVAPDSSDDIVMPHLLGHGGGVTWTGGDPVGMADAAGFQLLQMVPYHDGNNDGLLEQFPREHGFQMQPGCGGFQCASAHDLQTKKPSQAYTHQPSSLQTSHQASWDNSATSACHPPTQSYSSIYKLPSIVQTPNNARKEKTREN